MGRGAPGWQALRKTNAHPLPHAPCLAGFAAERDGAKLRAELRCTRLHTCCAFCFVSRPAPHHSPSLQQLTSACLVAPLPATARRRNLSRETAWEAVMRIRCSKGLRISAFFGHFFIRSTGAPLLFDLKQY